MCVKRTDAEIYKDGVEAGRSLAELSLIEERRKAKAFDWLANHHNFLRAERGMDTFWWDREEHGDLLPHIERFCREIE